MYVAAIFLPLLAAFIAGFFRHWLGDRGAQLVTTGAVLVSAVLSAVIFYNVAIEGHAVTVELLKWIVSGDMDVSWSLRIDTLTAVMLIVVTWISTCVHVYSWGYMHHDKSIPRFMAYLCLFTFTMLMLVTSDNLVQLFFGWEGVGLASYLLIGFWYERPSACAAAIKAFVVNRVGDFGFALGIFGVFYLFGTVNFDDIFAAAPQMADATVNLFGFQWHALTIVGFLLFIGAVGKSAQLGLHTWLPDAMEGPTPVSALIHAATMVTAGVFMLSRMSPMLEYAPTLMAIITVLGATTAFFAATIGCVQTDIKRVIAYSTCSQLGYMFFAIGVSGYQAAVFHLTTHAFFKALLFLGAGSVIHAMSDEQDMRKMGGIWKAVPVTYVVMWIGSLALAGIYPFAGYWSKDTILEIAYAAHTGVGTYAFVLGVAAAALTAFYSWRLLFLTFHGKPRADEYVMSHVHESPWIMLGPLVVLALGALFAGWIGYDMFVGDLRESFWRGAILVLEQNDSIHHAHEFTPGWVKTLPLVLSVCGIALAYVMYILAPGIPVALARMFRPVYLFLLNKWYFDELYDFLFVRPAKALGRGFWKGGDGALIDGVGPDGVAAATRDIARRVGRLQSGMLYHYAFAMIIGVAVFVTWYMVHSAG